MGLSRRERRRLKMVVAVAGSVLAVGGTVTAFAALADNRTPPPVSAKVASAYASGLAEAEKAPATKPSVSFIGDSYTAGTGASSSSLRWTTVLSAKMGWVEHNLGKGGTGYMVNGSGCGADFCPNYQQSVADAVKVSPDVVVVSGGRNDYKAGVATVTPAVAKTMQAIRKALPKATIVAISPFFDDKPEPSELAAIGEVVKKEAVAVGGIYLDVGEPLLGHAELLAADGHPNDGGYALLAKAVEAKVRAARNPVLSGTHLR